MAAAEAPYKMTSGRPGTIMWNGLGQPVGANPLMVESFGPEGNKTPAFITPPLPGSSPGAAGSPSVSGGFRDTSGSLVTGLGPGVVRGLETRATKEEDQRQKIIDDANAALRDQATVKTMASESDNFTRGPFADHVQEAARYLRLIDPSWNGQVASYEDFTKNAGQLTRQAVRETSARAAVQEFQMIANTLPSPEMSPIGMRRVQNELLGLSDFRIAKAQAQRQWEGTHNNSVSGFETAFATQASPYSFIVARMDPQDRKGLIAKLQGTDEGRNELARLGQQMQVMKGAGLGQY